MSSLYQIGKSKASIKYFRKVIKKATEEIKSKDGKTNLYKAVNNGLLIYSEREGNLNQQITNMLNEFYTLFPEQNFNLIYGLFKVYNSENLEELLEKFREFYEKLTREGRDEVRALIISFQLNRLKRLLKFGAFSGSLVGANELSKELISTFGKINNDTVSIGTMSNLKLNTPDAINELSKSDLKKINQLFASNFITYFVIGLVGSIALLNTKTASNLIKNLILIMDNYNDKEFKI